MQDLESEPLAIMAQHKHPGTGLSLEWKPEDTAAAREAATILKQRLRDREEDLDNAEAFTNDEYLLWFTYETRYRLCLEQRPAAVLVKSDTTAYREAKVQSVTNLFQLPRRLPRLPPSPRGVGSRLPFSIPADHMLKYSQLRRVLPCEVKSSLRGNGRAHAILL